MNWKGHPLVDYETIVQLIGAIKTSTGLKQPLFPYMP